MTTEERAMVGDKNAVLAVISALRRYRIASKELLCWKYGDGGLDGVAVSKFGDEVGEIEQFLEGFAEDYRDFGGSLL